MINENYPPEGRLTDQQRAVMRADLMAALHETPKTGRRWLAPLGVAAAVATLVGVGIAGTAALQSANDGGTTGVPAAGRDTPSSSPLSTAPSPTPLIRPNAEQVGREQCDESYIYHAYPTRQLRNTQLLGSVSYDGGTTYLYEAEGRWWFCDDWRTQEWKRRGHFDLQGNEERVVQVPAISSAHGVANVAISPEKFLIAQYSVPDDTMAHAMDPDGYHGGYHTQLLAGGAALEGVTAISYAFPTGEVVDATVTDKMWQMVHVAPNDKGYQEGWRDPVVVTVTKTDGSTQQLELPDAFGSCGEVTVGGC